MGSHGRIYNEVNAAVHLMSTSSMQFLTNKEGKNRQEEVLLFQIYWRGPPQRALWDHEPPHGVQQLHWLGHLGGPAVQCLHQAQLLPGGQIPHPALHHQAAQCGRAHPSSVPVPFFIWAQFRFLSIRGSLSPEQHFPRLEEQTLLQAESAAG